MPIGVSICAPIGEITVVPIGAQIGVPYGAPINRQTLAPVGDTIGAPNRALIGAFPIGVSDECIIW